MNKAMTLLIIGSMTMILAACGKPVSTKNALAGVTNSATSPIGPGGTPSANTNAGSQPPIAAQNANASANSDSTGGTGSSEQPDVQKLVGTYELNQMEKKGVTVMMSKIKTQIIFSPDGKYSLATEAAGQATHTESGQFHIEGDSLVFMMILSDRDIKTTPERKRSKMSLNSDGKELRLVSKTGEVAVFYRIG